MENRTNTSSKVFSGVYALLAIFSATLIVQSLITGQAFSSFRGIIFIIAAVVTFIVTSIAVWVKWNDTFPYNYETPYKISKTTAIVKDLYGCFAITFGLFVVFLVVSLYLFESREIFVFVIKYGVILVMASTALLFPFIRKHMK